MHPLFFHQGSLFCRDGPYFHCMVVVQYNNGCHKFVYYVQTGNQAILMWFPLHPSLGMSTVLPATNHCSICFECFIVFHNICVDMPGKISSSNPEFRQNLVLSKFCISAVPMPTFCIDGKKSGL